MSKRYRIIRTSVNCWHMDGTPIVEKECEVLHRSLRAAYQKHCELIGYNKKTGMWSAAWHGSIITEVFPDGTYRFGLDRVDKERLNDIAYDDAHRMERG